MTNSKWLRRALLGGVAISVMSSGAQADDLGDLKSQIEALQTRVNSLKSTPSTNLPEGASLITFQRGQGSLADWNVDRAQEGEMPADRGFTIAVTPTADVPAPVTEVTVSGYVKGDFIWDFNENLGDTFAAAGIDDRNQNDVEFHAHAKQTRFRIKSSTDTAIGQIRTLIEGDFFGSGNSAGSYRLRHAWGEWDMTPNWTLGIGRFWSLGYDVFTGVSTVDFGGSIGAAGNARSEQVRLTYSSGPVTFAFGIQDPVNSVRQAGVFKAGSLFLATIATPLTDSPDFPEFGAHLLYDVPGGHQLFLGANVAQHQLDTANNPLTGNESSIGWHVAAGANLNLGDIATLTGHIAYADGLTSHIYGGGADTALVVDVLSGSTNLRNNRAWGSVLGLSFDLTDTITANAQWGYVDPQGSHAKDAGVQYTHMHTVHANIMWQPVRQMRLGWEVMYGRKTYGTRFLNANPGAKKNNDAIRGQFGAWFFF